MGFFKRLFGGDGKSSAPYVDKQGVYFYVMCDNCGTPVKVRADKTYDLINEGGGYVWHKTVVDSRCFKPMPTIVHLDGDYNMVSNDIQGGHYISEAEYEAALLADQTAGDAEADDETAGDR